MNIQEAFEALKDNSGNYKEQQERASKAFAVILEHVVYDINRVASALENLDRTYQNFGLRKS